MAPRILTIFGVLGILAGCAQLHAHDQLACSGYGFQPGTESFANCMMQRDLSRRVVVSTDDNAGFWNMVNAQAAQQNVWAAQQNALANQQNAFWNMVGAMP